MNAWRWLMVPVLLSTLGAARAPVMPRCTDLDGDGYFAGRRCPGPSDCDDRDATIYPGAVQLSQARNNDCAHPNWPFVVGTREFDDDQDGWTEVQGDCNDADPAVHPGAAEVCDGVDNDCSGVIDDGAECPTTCDGANLLGSLVRVTDSPADSGAPVLAWTGSEYGVAWEDLRTGNFGGEIFFTRLDAQGNEIGDDLRVTEVDGPSYEPQLIWNGNEFGLTWYVPFIYIHFDRIDASGQVLGPSQPVTGSKDGYGTRLAWDGTHYAVTWLQVSAVNAPRVTLARFTGTGGYLGSTEIAVGADTANPPSIARGEGGYGVAWIDTRAASSEVAFAKVDSMGALLHEGPVTTAAVSPAAPQLIWSGNGYGLFWTDLRRGQLELYFAHLDAAGNKLVDDRPLDVPEGTAVAWTGAEYGLAWSDGDGLHFGRRSATGEKLGTDLLLAGTAGVRPVKQLVWNGRGFGLVWVDARDGHNEIHFARIGCAAADDGSGDDGSGDDGSGDDGSGDDGSGDDGSGDDGSGDDGSGDDGSGDDDDTDGDSDQDPADTLAYFSLTVDQFLQGSRRQREALSISPSGVVDTVAAFLPHGLGLDALVQLADGDLLFSISGSGLLSHAGGFERVFPDRVYRFTRATGTVTLEVDWADLSGSIGDLTALDRLADGSLLFGVGSTRGVTANGTFIVLRSGNVYRYVPQSRSIELWFDGLARGLNSLDAIDVDAASRVLVFSTSVDQHFTTPSGGVVLRQQSAYRLGLDDGEITLVFDGRAAGLGSLDALGLSPATKGRAGIEAR